MWIVRLYVIDNSCPFRVQFSFPKLINNNVYFCALCAGGMQCGPPPGPLNAKMVLGTSDQVSDDANQLHNAGTVVSYVCDPGFESIGYFFHFFSITFHIQRFNVPTRLSTPLVIYIRLGLCTGNGHDRFAFTLLCLLRHHLVTCILPVVL